MRSGIDCKGRKYTETSLPKRANDLTNMTFGRLKALFPVYNDKNTLMWLCVCQCGNEVVVDPYNLRSGHTTSCGCYNLDNLKTRFEQRYFNLVGTRFGRLIVVEYEGMKYTSNQSRPRPFLLCNCDCGNQIDVNFVDLDSGHVQSCGCLKSENTKNRWEQYREDNSIIGKTFGMLTTIDYLGVKEGHACYKFQCSCGNQIEEYGFRVTSGHVSSCGCAKSLGENRIKNILEDNKICFKKEYAFSDLVSKNNGYLRYDFVIFQDNHIARLIEFDGPQHQRPYDGFGGVESFLIQQENDALKNQYALSHNIPLVRIPYSKRNSITLDDILGNKYLIKGDN